MTTVNNTKSRSPGLPIPNPGLSFWQKTTRAFPHLNANSETPVPASSKYVVVGSGLAGSLTAYELLEAGIKGDEVVILEAREAASGASARNAGHVRPDAFRGFPIYAALHGIDQARKVVENERLVLHKIDEFVKKHNVPCDFNFTTTFDVCMTPEFATYEAAAYDAFKAAGGDVSHVKVYVGGEAQAKTRVKDAVAAYEWPAGSSHPAKLTQWILNSCVARGVKIFTHCPVSSITRAGSQTEKPDAATSSSWALHTPRGIIVTPTVIHCTNAHAGLLLPQLSPYITPTRSQVTAITPTRAFAGESTLKSTLSIRYTMKYFHSLIQRQGDGTLIFGVSRGSPALSAQAVAQLETTDDSSFSREILQESERAWRRIFPDYSRYGVKHGEGLDHVWTGIIAMTADHVPFVGAVESLPGQYVCTGFNGHGMARIFTCAPGIVKLILGGQWSETGLPECFQMSESRLAGLGRQETEPVDQVWQTATSAVAVL
ncbi:hypothetical protein A1O3_02897 [Capronia epimyces CBS 606.96]|uniref:FAD dependent oxidoreductase domain-containing protein n=1 Tax=Capronia epimyces CBS 606.96 TaxID=1182542 RepID=W9YJH5_9EURO|nr:uncharacterized protein A1O3_02897 [Capronia epimyces CBS 606.96]EXJ89830.1 hypothetical protein A1O3_02897 [Capronia epimyces CBS 606.96]